MQYAPRLVLALQSLHEQDRGVEILAGRRAKPDRQALHSACTAALQNAMHCHRVQCRQLLTNMKVAAAAAAAVMAMVAIAAVAAVAAAAAAMYA
jgi:hypothetical protein